MTLHLIFSVWIRLFSPISGETVNPLSEFDPSWNKGQYTVCNTAAQRKYLTENEKEVVYILNLVRQNPQHFNKTVVAKWPEKYGGTYLRSNTYYQSLVKQLSTMKPAPVLQPDSLAWVSALCHAFTSGKAGYDGHERQTDQCQEREYFGGECCHYGHSTPLQTVMALLIDDDIPSLGHRMICLSQEFKGIGVSIQPHKVYGFNAVLDFTR
ncbi:MAG: hypothetical protein MUE71_00840 [Chitinophagaceae bacterium]|nr:hypothetical protein [Chitinophagaceae bacterium]